VLEGRCRELELPVRREPVEGSADNLVIAWVHRPALLLNAHVDTIRPTWTWDGRAAIERDTVAGLGALDDKGGVVACLLALLLARAEGVGLEGRSVGVGLTVDEERGGKGSIVMARELRPAHVVVAEGTDLGLGLVEAGTVEVWVRFEGRAVHGALRDEGDNAAERAVRMAAEALDLPILARRHPMLGTNAPMLWEIRSGQELNVVPDRAEVHLDVRVNPGTSAAEVCEALGEVSARHRGVLEVVELVESFETPADDPVARALARSAAAVMGTEPAPFAMPAWTDAHNFVDLAGSRAIVFGPSHLRSAHRPDERVDVRDVVTTARIFAGLLADPMWG
ncbi:MAG TPA: M20/M25/M40 family metallo-hydrolase, partial [Actinomycetota bacterium]|nr:M20/M25/M40 family metallo-hydrolase [Actinomycetota bacterium]